MLLSAAIVQSRVVPVLLIQQISNTSDSSREASILARCLCRSSLFYPRGVRVMLLFAERKRRKRNCRSVFSHQVIGMFPGKDGQAPFVTCAAKVIPAVAPPSCLYAPAAHPLPPLHFVKLSFLHRATLSFIPLLFCVVHFLSFPLLCCINLSRLSDTESAKMNG